MAEGDLIQPGLRASQVRKIKFSKKYKREADEEEQVELEKKALREQEPPAFLTEEPDLPTAQHDFWTCNGEVLIRHHKTPRTKLYVPTEDESPIPLKFLDIFRSTKTDLEGKKESEFDDYWTETGDKELSDPWTGRTRFEILRPEPPKGYKYVQGRLTRKQKTAPPDTAWP